MKKVSYSKDVDALLIEISNDAIAYAEEDGQVILHYSPDDKLVLIEILDFRRFVSKESVALINILLKTSHDLHNHRHQVYPKRSGQSS
jgi:hypothetical protein